MIDFIKKNIFIIVIFLITLFIGFITFLTFIDKSFLKLSDNNLQILLIGNIALLILLFFMIFSEVRNSLKIDVDVSGSKANRKYITFFALFTLIPSILISLFSLFLLSFALDKYLDKKITTAVNNSYEMIRNWMICRWWKYKSYEVENVRAFGRIGFGVVSYDQQDMAANKNGVSSIKTSFNGNKKIINQISEIENN